MPPKTRVSIVGAGIAGLTAAEDLAGRDLEVVVWDKGFLPGGRTASRRRRRFEFDHGAQYFTARHPEFRARVDQWMSEGVVARWEPRIRVFGPGATREARGQHERFVGIPRMSSLAERLSRDLDVRTSHRIAGLQREGVEWRLLDESGLVIHRADVVLVTAPPAQSAALLENAAPELATKAASVVLRPCWAVLLGFDRPLPVDFDAAFVNEGALSWIARNSHKPERSGGEAWVLHGSPAWSEEHAGASPDVVVRALSRALAHTSGLPEIPVPVHAEAHRWRWALPDLPLREPCLYDADLHIGAGGDWCGGPKIEGAFHSGAALAARVLAGQESRVSSPGHDGV